METNGSPGTRPGVRWWPAVVLVAMAAAAVAWEWSQDVPFQRKNLSAIGIVGGHAIALLFWWVGASGASVRARAIGTLVVLVAVALPVSLLRIRGVSGDLLPVFEPRWRRAGPVALANPSPPQASSSLVVPGEYPQFLGPDRNGIVPGPEPETDWKAHPPRELWRTPVGTGWSGFAVSAGRAVTHEQAGDEERLVCRDAATGAIQWTHAESGHYATTIAGEGPRATPTIAGGRVYALGSLGTLVCVDLATGGLAWHRSLRDEVGAGVPSWGFSGSPLVAGGRVIVSAGGSEGRSVVAFDAMTGARSWASGDEGNSYGSPLATVLDGVPQVVVFGGRSVAAHDATSGKLLWKQAWGVGQPLVAMPVVTGPDRLVVSAGYGVGAEMFVVRRAAGDTWTVRSEWGSKRMKAKFSNPVRLGGMVVGLDDGILAAIDLADGHALWKEGRYGHGQSLLCGGVLLVMAESGELVALRPDATGPHELARTRVFSGKTWNPVALAGDRLYLRNDTEAACLRIDRHPGR